MLGRYFFLFGRGGWVGVFCHISFLFIEKLYLGRGG